MKARPWSYLHSDIGATLTCAKYYPDSEDRTRVFELLHEAYGIAWRRCEIEREAVAGSHVIRTRATDMAGNTQPDEVPFNESGYLLNIPLPHPVEVV